MSLEVVDAKTPVKTLKRVAAALDIESAGAEKPDLVASVKRRRLETQGFDWLVDTTQLFTAITFDFEPASNDERIYQLRHQSVNFVHKPEFSKRVLEASREEFATLPEFKQAFESSQLYLNSKECDNAFYARLADSIAGGVVVGATVRRDIMDETGIDPNDEDAPSKDIPLDTVVLTLSESSLTVFFGDGYAVVKKPSVTMLDVVLAIEDAAIQHSWPERPNKVVLPIKMRVERDDDGTRMIVNTV